MCRCAWSRPTARWTALHPGRIDLGIGRAGGSDGRTLSALRSVDGSYFPQELAELLAFEQGRFPADHPFAPIRVVPENVTLPPIFILGSSGASAAAAGELGRRLFVRGPFQRDARKARRSMPIATRSGRRRSSRSRTRSSRVSALVAPTAEEAKFLSTSQAVSWALFHSGEERRLMPPEEARAAS